MSKPEAPDELLGGILRDLSTLVESGKATAAEASSLLSAVAVAAVLSEMKDWRGAHAAAMEALLGELQQIREDVLDLRIRVHRATRAQAVWTAEKEAPDEG